VKIHYIIIFLLFITAAAQAQEKTAMGTPKSDSKADTIKPDKVEMSYGKKGWQFEYGNKYLMQLEWRVQSRYLTQTQNSVFYIEEEDSNDKSFNLQRFRLKVGGYAYKPYITYYFEYDFPSNSLLNTVITVSKYKALQFKVGQWKIEYNTERYISSGKQQLVDRSVSNRYFTLDRQIGVMLLGDLFTGTLASSTYNIGVFNGNGRMAQNDDGQYLFFARYQWNLWRRKMKMSYSDLSIVQKPEGFIAFAYVNNTSRYTSFSTSGGGHLPGYSEEDGQNYQLNQYNLELMFKYKGLSLTSENHIKNIDNLKTHESSQIIGGYAMAGYFFHQLIPFVPEPLEIITRFALINNKTFCSKNINEYIIGANWFFSGHRNKLSVDVSYIENQDFVDHEDNVRVRLQWDISF